MKSYAFLTTKDFEIYGLQKELQSLIPSISALTYSRTSTPFVLYVHADELTQEEIEVVKEKVK